MPSPPPPGSSGDGTAFPPRPRAPTITIVTAVHASAPPCSQQDLIPARAPTPVPDRRLAAPHENGRLSSDDIASPNALTENDGLANLLNVPVSSKHVRTDSVSSEMTVGSTWSPSASPTTPATDIQEEDRDDATHKLFGVNHHHGAFAFSLEQLAALHQSRDLALLKAMGGLDGLCIGLRTDLDTGLSPTEDSFEMPVTFSTVLQRLQGTVEEDDERTDLIDLEQGINRAPTERTTRFSISSRKGRPKLDFFTDRKRAFGENVMPTRKPKSLFSLMWAVLQDKVLVLLCIAAIVSLALGLYQTFRPGSQNKLEWIEGVAILTAVAIATIAQSVNDYQKERQFRKLNKKNEDRHLKVVRGGRPQLISIHEILVGDIMMMEPGEVVPVDGIFAEGFNVSCDESTLTGETKSIHKTPAPMALEGYSPQRLYRKGDCFIFSGSKVVEGVGKMVVTSVGENSCYGRMLLSFKDHHEEETPLQLRLDRIADMIAKWGTGMAFLLFIILVTRFFIMLPNNPESASEKMGQFMQIVIIAVSIVVVAVPEGLPLAVTLALAYATVRMIKDNNLVRVLKACETMGNATTICSDKTGTLTENKMIVVAGSLGRGNNFARASVDTADHLLDMPDMNQFFRDLAPETSALLQQSIALNSTAFETTDENGAKSFVGSTTETALLYMAKELLGMDDVATERANANVVQQLPFSSERKFMGTVIKLDKGYRLLVKGAPEMVLSRSTKLLQPTQTDHFHLSSGTTADRSIVASSRRRTSQISEGSHLDATEMSINDRNDIVHLCTTFASDALRLLGFAYRDFATWPPKGISSTDNILLDHLEEFFNELSFCGVIAMKDPLRPGVIDAVLKCRKAGVSVRMVTGDNILTAKAVARECGILTPGGIVMDGTRFRSMVDGELDVIVPRLQVLARSTPDDKRRLVERLKSLGEVVAVTGDGTNDGPALITADVGFSMGISGTEVAKEASSIILMDDNFSSIVNAIAWGRCVNDAVKKFLQFQLTVSVTAVGITFVTAIASSEQTPSITAVQLLWVNLIQDTLGALALATDPPTLALLDRPPVPKSAPMITFPMWKMIFGQGIVQLSILITMSFAGPQLTGWTGPTLRTVIFNTFMWLQFFNEINCRRLDNRFNVFEGIHKNLFFVIIMATITVGQILIINFGGAAFSTTRLNFQQWLVSVAIGLISLPSGALIRLIPDSAIKFLLPRRRRRIMLAEDDHQPHDHHAPHNLQEAFSGIRDNLRFFKTLRSKPRINQRRYRSRLISITGTMSDSDSLPSPPQRRSLSFFKTQTVVPAIIASSITFPVVPGGHGDEEHRGGDFGGGRTW